MNCIYFKKRRKNYVGYTYCTIKRSKIEYEECKYCDKKEYRKMKPIRPVSKKRVTVSKATYGLVLMRDKRCRLCGRINYLQLHHILYRSERKDLIDDPKNCIMLCSECHKLVHSNKRKYQPMLQKLVEKSYKRPY